MNLESIDLKAIPQGSAIGGTHCLLLLINKK